jgi:hypothetical protein
MIVFYENRESEEMWSVHISKSNTKCWWCLGEIKKGQECFWPTKHGSMHVDCAKFKESLRPSWWIAERLKISSGQFLRLAKQFGIMPNNSYTNRFDSNVPLWDPALVEKMKDKIGVIDAQARRRRIDKKKGKIK